MVTNHSFGSFFVSALTCGWAIYFLALLIPFFRRKAKEVGGTQALTNITNVIFSLQRFLSPLHMIVEATQGPILFTLGFWVANAVLGFVGVEYLGFWPAVFFGIPMGIYRAARMYHLGKSYYFKIKHAVVEELSYVKLDIVN